MVGAGGRQQAGRILNRAVALVVVPAAFACAVASPALAVSDWTEPAHEITVEESNAEAPKVAIADNGSAVVVWWVRPDDPNGKDRVQYATRVRGGNFSAPKFLSGPDVSARAHIRLAMNKAGDAIVVWEADAGNGTIDVRSAYKPADEQDFGEEQIVENADGSKFVEPEVGIDGQGAATVIYHAPPGAFGDFPDSGRGSIYVSKARPGGAGSTWPASSQALVSHDFGSEASPIRYTETHGSIAVAEDGDQFAIFASQQFVSQDPPIVERQVVKSVSREAGETGWLFRGEDDNAGADVEVTSTNVRYQRGADNVVASYSEGSSLYASYRAQFKPIDPPFAGPTNGSGSDLMIDSTGDPLALWSSENGSALRANFTPFDPGTFADPADGDPVAGNGDSDERLRPKLAADDNDNGAATFRQKVGDDETVQAAARPAGGTTKLDSPVTVRNADNGQIRSGAPVDLDTCDLETDDTDKKGTGPVIAMNSGGEGVAAWSCFDGVSSFVVKTSLLVPRTVTPPPPPPPRPRPAQPSIIQLARPQERDKATVLIANVGSDVTELQWSFGSANEPPIVGRVVDGQLQRTVRLRLPDRSFRATVRVVGPGGSTTHSRSFATPSPSSSSESKEVRQGLREADTPPVFAVGRKETLTAQSDACSTATVWSGQQKFEGCFKPIEDLVDIPELERGVIAPLADELGLDETRRGLMEKATDLSDGYVAEGRTLLNDKFPVTPDPTADVVAFPQAKALVSAKAELPVGGGSFDPRNGFNLKLDTKKANIPLGKLPRPPKLPSLAGLEIVGDWDVNLEKQEAKIKASVRFPPAFKKGGVQLSNEVILRATPERVIVDEVRVGPIDVDITALKVQKFQIQYKREPDQWDGQGKACVVLACLDMIPPNGGVTIKGGDLTFAGGSLVFPPPGVPLFTGVNLERVGFGIGLRPTRINANARVGIGQILKLDGRVLVAFPDSATPYIFDRRDAGNGYPDRFYGQRFTRTTLGASAEAFLAIPVVGETRLANAYVLYEYPDYAAFGGGFGAEFLGIVSISGAVDAEADFGDGLFNIHGSVRSCIHVIDDLCSGATGNVSRGRGGTGGAGACIQLGPVSVGGGVQWQRIDEPFIWPFDGCKWSRFRATVRESNVSRARGPTWARASSPLARPLASAAGPGARASAPLMVRVEPGESPAVQLNGRDAAPFVRVTGPGGTLSSGPGTGFATTPDNTIRIMRFQNAQARFAVVGFQNAKPGSYAIEPLPGSPAITSIKQTTNPPPARIRGRVRGRGSRRVLHFNVRRRQDQRVIFEEIGPGGTAKRIGSIAGGGRGRIRFRPAPGRARRKVVAQFVLAGINAERRTFASFRPPSMRLPRPRRLSVRRAGRHVRARWRKVSGARRYEVAALLSNGRMMFKTTRRTRVSFRVPRWLTGRVSVRAIDGLRQSRTARSRRFRAIMRRPSPFRPLLRCTIRGRRIFCAPVGARCAGRAPTIVARRGGRVRGTRGPDVILGSSGRDRINGRGGSDVICGGGGRDRIDGAAGNDRLFGGTGNDRLKGGRGNDRIAGGPGNDAVVGGPGGGRDVVSGGGGNDRIETSDRGALDRVDCGPGRDRVRTDAADRVRGCERRRIY